MILITLIIAYVLIFFAGVHWCAYKVDSIEQRPRAINSMWWSVFCGILGLYHIISLVGMAARN